MPPDEEPSQKQKQHLGSTELTLSLLCKSLYSHNPDGIVCYDASMIVTAWNDAMAQITGISSQKAIGSSLFQLLPVFTDPSFQESAQLALEGKASILPTSSLLALPYKQSVQLSGHCIPLMNEVEEVIGGIVTLHPHEPTLQHQKEAGIQPGKKEAIQDLRKESELLATMGSWENNISEKVITWSDNMYTLFDLPYDYPLEIDLLNRFILPEDLPLINKSIEDLLSYPNQSIYHSYRIKTQKGEVKYLEGHIRSFVNEKGEVYKFKGYIRDVTKETENRNILREILNSSLDGVSAFHKVVDEEGKIVDFTYQLINKQGCLVIGKTEEEVLGQRLLTLFPAVKKLGLFDLYVRVTEKGTVEETETYYPFDGLNLWLKIIVAPLANGIVITFSDITRQIHNEHKIIEQRHRLLEMQHLAQMGQFEWDMASNALYWTDTQYEIFELDKYTTYLTIAFFYSHIHEDDLPLLLDAIDKCCREHSIQSFEYRIVTAKRKTKYVKGQLKPLLNTAGTLEKLIGYCLDITELKAAEIKQQETNRLLQETQNSLQKANTFLEEKIVERTQELANKNQELEKLLNEFHFVTDFMPQIVWASNKEGKNEFLNKRWFDYTGTKQSNEFHNVRDAIMHPEDVKAISKIWETAQREKVPFEAEGRMQRYDGEYRWFLMRSHPLKDGNGEVIKWYGTSTDIHDQKMALTHLTLAREELNEINHELRKKNDQLQRVNNDLDNFIYTASHDLKAPISNIEGLIDALSDLCEEDQGMQEIISMIDTSIYRFKATLGDLTDIAKASNTESNEIESVSFKEIIDEIKSDIKPLIEFNSASVLEDLSINKFHFSRKNLRSILYNLISNAIKYRSPDRNPLVIISTWTEDNNLVISVEDNGLGIKEADKAKVFMMFKRLHTHVEGSGVGMYIVKKIIEHAGGKISIESEINKGTQFKVYLPLYTSV